MGETPSPAQSLLLDDSIFLHSGLLEELCSRGSLETRLERLFSVEKALLIQAVIFGLYHLPPVVSADPRWPVVGGPVLSVHSLHLRRDHGNNIHQDTKPLCGYRALRKPSRILPAHWHTACLNTSALFSLGLLLFWEEDAKRPYENYSEDEQTKLNDGFSNILFFLYFRD